MTLMSIERQHTYPQIKGNPQVMSDVDGGGTTGDVTNGHFLGAIPQLYEMTLHVHERHITVE